MGAWLPVTARLALFGGDVAKSGVTAMVPNESTLARDSISVLSRDYAVPWP